MKVNCGKLKMYIVKLKWGLENPIGQIQPTAYFCKQSLLEHKLHLVTYYLWLLLHHSAESVTGRDLMAHKAYNAYYLALYRKSLPTRAVE